VTRPPLLVIASLAVVLITPVRAGAPPTFAPGVQHAMHDKVADAIQRQRTPGTSPIELIARDNDLGVRVNVARKVTNRMAEVHATYGHIFYIQEGTGTVVLGGELVEPKENRPGEWTGTATTGGKEYRVTKGDLITVQVGMPHWWKETSPEGVIFIAFHAYPEKHQPK
jgi:mannose-6-phosphate isomerase-like protein (cupin superfamily)